MTYSPGPWEPVKAADATGDWGIVTQEPTSRSNPILLAECFEFVGVTADEKNVLVDSRANAYLMAAAPEMLATLQEVINTWGIEDQTGGIFDRMRRVIVHAQGGRY